MKKIIALLCIFCMAFFSFYSYAEEYNLSVMSYEDLETLKKEIEKEMLFRPDSQPFELAPGYYVVGEVSE